MIARPEILNWLREPDERRLEPLWQQANEVRRTHVGDAVHLRGLVEISNHCVRACGYCGLRTPNRRLQRYRMTAAEITACARQAVAFGYGTIVLQSGEDPGLTTEWVADLVAQIKHETGLAVTLSLGEREPSELAEWRRAGADRYLLRFETSNLTLYDAIHPPRPGKRSDRVALLRTLRELGYEVGSGVMIGIPGQTYADLADDLELFRELDLDMIGAGPFLPHPNTPLGRSRRHEGTEAPRQGGTGILPVIETTPDDQSPSGSEGHRPEVRSQKSQLPPPAAHGDQVPNSELMTYKVLALARLLCPRANIPSTTALATLNPGTGRELGLLRGANIIMPNLTPAPYRRLYEIYPAKARLYEHPVDCDRELKRRIIALGRTIGTGPGGSPNWLARHARPRPAASPARPEEGP